uniref:Bm10569, isoform c n=1 Tax=Brugia malayi TaxID=6279 RepID=A0A1I9G3R6_BRUMA|nr:Bm10569, isoform c [Brugia malayi]
MYCRREKLNFECLFVVIMLHLLIVIQARDCNIRNYLDVNYFHASNDSSSIVGVTSACTVFIVPDSLIPNSNFLEELKLIDSDRRKVCYDVNVHILQSRQLIVLFLRQAHFAVAANYSTVIQMMSANFYSFTNIKKHAPI